MSVQDEGATPADGEQPEVEVVPLDEPSMEEYQRLTRCWCIDGDTCTRDGVPLPGEFCFKAQQKPVQVRDGVKDTS